MRWSRLLLSGGAVLGAAATYNAAARRGAAALDNRLGGSEEWFTWRGRRIAFTRRGEGSPVLLVHGIHAAASSFEWRGNVEALAARHTVYTIDLLGFGLSDRPPIRYAARLYTALIDDFVDRVVRAPVALVANSLSAAYAIVLGARDAARYPALVLVQPTGLVRLHQPASAGNDVARMAIDAPVVGTAMFNALVSRRSLRLFLRQAYADESLVSEQLVDAYYDVAHQPGARHAPAAFVAGHLNVDVRHSLRRLVQPTLLAWGEHAEIAPVDEARGFLALKSDLELAIFDPSGDLPHDERAAEFNETVLAFLDRALGASGPAAPDARTRIGASRTAGAA
jgi:pimeloyl-ACP methyl ester carboxylesterase